VSAAAAVLGSSNESQLIVTVVNSTTYNVLSLSKVPATKETIHVNKRDDGLFKVHVMSTNQTFNVATVCPELNTVQKDCVALTFNEDLSLLVSTQNVSFSDSLTPEVHLVTVKPSASQTSKSVVSPANENLNTDNVA
jgi:hypothetical protein